MRSRSIIQLLFFVCGITASMAQSFSVSIQTTQEKIRIGEAMQFTIAAKSDNPELKLNWPDSSNLSNARIEVLNSKLESPKINLPKAPKFIQQWILTLTAYDSGMFQLPELSICEFAKPNECTRIPEIKFLAQTVPTDTNITKLKPLKSVFEIPFDWKWYRFEISMGLLALTALIVLVVFLIKRRRRIKPKIEIPLPADVEALKKLETLINKELWKHGEVKLHYTQLSELIKFYIERRFMGSVMELTTAELVLWIQKHLKDALLLKSLETILTQSDFTKFAKQYHTEAIHQELILLTRNFIEQTREQQPQA